MVVLFTAGVCVCLFGCFCLFVCVAWLFVCVSCDDCLVGFNCLFLGFGYGSLVRLTVGYD